MPDKHDCSKCQAPEICAISAEASLTFIKAIYAIGETTKNLGATMVAMDALISGLALTERKAKAEIARRTTVEQPQEEGRNYG
jgi:hypothetical protein